MKRTWVAIVVSMAAWLAMPSAYAQGEVARSVITSAVVDREPTDDLEAVPGTTSKVVFFTELRNMEGQTIKHRWMRGDEQMAEVSFNVGGPRWRIWSSKNMMPEWTGEWKVEVIDSDGNALAEKSFTYGSAEAMGMDMATEGEKPMTEEKPMMEEKPMAEEKPMSEEKPMGEEKPMQEAPMGGEGMTKEFFPAGPADSRPPFMKNRYFSLLFFSRFSARFA
jgi:hypothetical protein